MFNESLNFNNGNKAEFFKLKTNTLSLEKSYTKHITEIDFNNLLPHDLKQASQLYFTPIEIAQTAAEWLTENNEQKVLDIGSGIGKFCIAAARHSDRHFYGVEHRASLVELANELANYYQTKNVTFLNANILDINFSEYDSFYFFNSFYENLETNQRLNDEVKLEENLYQIYLDYTEKQLDTLKIGTRLVTYFGNNFEVPNSYERVRDAFDGSLKLWIKME